MKEFIFIHGKNPDISLAEIVSYFESRAVAFKIKENSNSFAIIDVYEIPNSMMEDLGGTIKIGEVLFSTKNGNIESIQEEILQKFDFNFLFKNLPEKVIFGVSSYKSRKEYEFFSKFFKEQMKKYGIRSGYIHIPKDRCALTHVEVIKKHLTEKYIEFLVCRKENFYLGKTLFVHNPFEFQKRDVKRPAQRTIFSIPPRLCKI